MVQIEDKRDILPGIIEKISCANSVSSIDKNAGRDLKSVGVINRRYWAFKRIMDIILALAALFIIAVPMLIVFLIAYIDDPGNVLFTQYRVGMGGRCFKLYKLRTMRQDTPKYMSTSEVDDPDRYITRIGRILRRLSIDELPQLINVLKGDMSIVGPRPERPEIIAEYCEQFPEFMYRTKVKAGLTGYAQVFGKYNTTSYDKLKWDLMYIEKFSIWLDLKLIIMTIKIVFMKESTEGLEEGKATANSNENEDE